MINGSPTVFSLHRGNLVATPTHLNISDNDASSKKWLVIGAYGLLLLFFSRNLYITVRDAPTNPFILVVNGILFLLGIFNIYLHVIRKSYAGKLPYSVIKNYKQRYLQFSNVVRVDLILTNGSVRNLFFNTSEEAAAFLEILAGRLKPQAASS